MKKKEQKNKEGVAFNLGMVLAYFQDAVDGLMGWTFGKLKDIEDEAEKNDEEGSKVLVTVKKFGKKTLSFIGEVGESFYENYEEIKKKRKRKK